MLRKLDGWRFGIEGFKDPIRGELECGIMSRAWSIRQNSGRGGSLGPRARLCRTFTRTSAATFTTVKRAPTGLLRLMTSGGSLGMRRKQRILDCCALILMWGLTVLITHYNTTELPDTDLKRFMNEQEFGARVLFTAFGVLLTFFWDHYFTRKRQPFSCF